MIEKVIVFVVVGLAVVAAFKRLIKTISGKRSGCSACASDCSCSEQAADCNDYIVK